MEAGRQGETGRGRFIVLDGIDGCGKSTQARMLIEHLGARLLAHRPVPSEAGLLRLGVIKSEDSIEAVRREEAFLLHTALADM